MQQIMIQQKISGDTVFVPINSLKISKLFHLFLPLDYSELLLTVMEKIFALVHHWKTPSTQSFQQVLAPPP